MKKWIALLLCAMMVLAAGCAKKEEEPEDTTYSAYFDADGHFKNIKALDLVTLPENYGKIPLPAENELVTEDEVEAEIRKILEEFASSEKVTDREVRDGDTVNIDYVGTADGVAFEGGSTQGNGTDVTIGVTNYIDDFLQQLIGHMPGETVNVEVTFPDPYTNDPSLSGKDAVFVTVINYITEKVYPEFTDSFVEEHLKGSYGWSGADEARLRIREELLEVDRRSFVRSWLTENAEIKDIPQPVMDYETRSVRDFYESMASYYGLPVETYLMYYVGVQSLDQAMELEKEYMVETAQLYLVLQAIAEKDGITVTEEDIASYFREDIGTEDYSQYEEFYGRNYLAWTVLMETIQDDLCESAIQ